MTLVKNTYPFPTSERVKWTVLRMLPAYIPLVVGLGLSIWVGVEYGAGRGFWGAFGPTLMLLAISAWGSYWYGVRYPKGQYTVNGLKVIFEDPDYFVPKDVFTDFLEVIYERFQPHVDDPKTLLKGVTLILLRKKPRYPTGDLKIGMTWPEKRVSKVFAPYVINHGGAGYELRLQCMHVLFPGQDEGKDIEWMKEHKVI